MIAIEDNPLIELPECRDGIVFGFLFRDSQVIRIRNWLSVDEVVAANEGVLWLHLDLSARQTRSWIDTCPFLTDEVREDFAGVDVRARIERDGEFIFGLLADIEYDIDPKALDMTSVRFFADAGHVITVRRHASRSVNDLRHAVHRGLAIRNAADLIAHLLNGTATTLEAAIAQLGGELDEIEDRLLEDRVLEARDALARTRRFTIRFHRYLSLKRRSTFRVVARPPAWFDEDDVHELRDAIELLGAVEDDLIATQERAKLLYEDMTARQADEANRNLLILSVLTAVFSPMTLVTGIFGMNVAGLPGLQTPNAFWWTILGMVVAGLAAFWGLRRLKVF